MIWFLNLQVSYISNGDVYADVIIFNRFKMKPSFLGIEAQCIGWVGMMTIGYGAHEDRLKGKYYFFFFKQRFYYYSLNFIFIKKIVKWLYEYRLTDMNFINVSINHINGF